MRGWRPGSTLCCLAHLALNECLGLAFGLVLSCLDPYSREIDLRGDLHFNVNQDATKTKYMLARNFHGFNAKSTIRNIRASITRTSTDMSF